MVVVDDKFKGIDDFVQIMGRNIGSHAHSDATGPIQQEIGQCRRQYQRLRHGFIEVRAIIDRLFVQIRQQFLCDWGEARLGVTHSCGAITIDRTKVALTINEWVAHGEVLGHTHHGVVDRRVTMWVELAEHLPDNTSAFAVGFI